MKYNRNSDLSWQQTNVYKGKCQRNGCKFLGTRFLLLQKSDNGVSQKMRKRFWPLLRCCPILCCLDQISVIISNDIIRLWQTKTRFCGPVEGKFLLTNSAPPGQAGTLCHMVMALHHCPLFRPLDSEAAWRSNLGGCGWIRSAPERWACSSWRCRLAAPRMTCHFPRSRRSCAYTALLVVMSSEELQTQKK